MDEGLTAESRPDGNSSGGEYDGSWGMYAICSSMLNIYFFFLPNSKHAGNKHTSLVLDIIWLILNLWKTSISVNFLQFQNVIKVAMN